MTNRIDSECVPSSLIQGLLFQQPLFGESWRTTKSDNCKSISYFNYLCAQFQWKMYIVFATVLFSYLFDWTIEMQSYVFWVKRLKDFYYFISLLFIIFLGLFFFYISFILYWTKTQVTDKWKLKRKTVPYHRCFGKHCYEIHILKEKKPKEDKWFSHRKIKLYYS